MSVKILLKLTVSFSICEHSKLKEIEVPYIIFSLSYSFVYFTGGLNTGCRKITEINFEIITIWKCDLKTPYRKMQWVMAIMTTYEILISLLQRYYTIA